jgi:uncharacterized protein YggE
MTYLDEKYTTAVTKTVLALLLIVTFFFVVMSVNQIRQGAYIGQSQDVQNTISVNGTGEATAIPDSARFTVGVRNEAETVEVAQAQSAETINEIIDYLQEAGVEKNKMIIIHKEPENMAKYSRFLSYSDIERGVK